MWAKDLEEDLLAFKAYLEFQLTSPNTIKAYLSDIKKSLEYIQKFKKIDQITKKDIEELSLNDWRSFFFHLQNKNLASKTQERYLISIKTYAKFKYKSQNIQLTINKLTNYKSTKSEIIMSFSKQEIFRFLSLFENPESITDYRNKALVYLLYSVGLRINEALNLKTSDLFNKYIKIRGKGNKTRMVPYFPRIKRMIKEYQKLTQSSKNEYIFLNNTNTKKWHACAVARLFQETCKKNNLKLIHPHMLRHACATHLLEAKCNLRSIQALLGHSSLEVTKKYINISNADLKQKFFEIDI